MKKTLGGDRLGSGSKMKVDLHNYERSTHDLSTIVRTTMSSGTLVPFETLVALPGDTFDINLQCEVMTHPTIGPLFGSYKVQIDVFKSAIRLYQAQLHNNKLGIGMNMANIKLPQMEIAVLPATNEPKDLDNSQINPSCLFPYLGIRGVQAPGILGLNKQFNALPYLMYHDIYKNYYANKQEEIGAGIHMSNSPAPVITSILLDAVVIPLKPAVGSILMVSGDVLHVNTGFPVAMDQLHLFTLNIDGVEKPFDEWLDFYWVISGVGGTNFDGYWTGADSNIRNYSLTPANQIPFAPPQVTTFPLENIDKMREYLLSQVALTTPVIINNLDLPPYNWLCPPDPISTGNTTYLGTQEGLLVKTYQSDLFNNWLSTEWIDGVNGITEITAVDTSGGSFTIDTLNLSKKVYNMLNRIAVSGGSYEDWIDAVYTHDRFTRIETPEYQGGLIKELVFQQVISNSSNTDAEQPLGTLAGRGTLSKKHKGGRIHIKIDEPSYIMMIISLTPRIDYSQGNKWDTLLTTMDDFHKPALDEIGFQELDQRQMAWWTREQLTPVKSAGKQPAWINYMTNINRTYGNFAIESNEMFMTLNRRYEKNPASFNILDLTTYIDPVKFNNIFAQTSIDAQNFWVQIGADITARRKMSAKIMPNL